MSTPGVDEAHAGGLGDGSTADSAETDGRPDQEAEEQTRTEARARLRRGRFATAVVVGVLVLAVGLVALRGGFARRTDLITPVATGSVVATGPYEVTVERATLQHTTSSEEWEVVAHGTARTTGSTSIGPSTGDNGFVYAKDLASGESQPVSTVEVGESASFEHLENLTPGLDPVPWALTFRFGGDPGASILVAVFQQEYTTPYLFSDERGWRATSAASTMTLPLERLPDTEY